MATNNTDPHRLLQDYQRLQQDWYNAPRLAELQTQIMQLPEEDQIIYRLLGGKTQKVVNMKGFLYSQ